MMKIYPENWTYDEILKCFLSYGKNNSCNVGYYGENTRLRLYEDSCVLMKDIIKDEELTCKYGEEKWIGWILLTAWKLNPMSDPVYEYPPNFPESEDEIKEAKEALCKVIVSLGYSGVLENTLTKYQISLSVEDGRNTAEKFGSAILSSAQNHTHLKI